MSLLFISHSGRNNDAARKVRDWLQDQGWGEVFLDLDPAQGLAPGQRWQEELRRAGERCSAVIVLISPDWAASSWCRTEFLVAVQLGKKIFPVIVAETPFQDLPVELIAHFQLADISKAGAEEEGFERLALGLKRAGLDPSNFSWPPPGDESRSPFRGLATLEEIDAAIFFGRDGAITRGLDTFRRLRDGAEERGIVIVGPSGVGKSSFLRAGLLARLERDETNFLVLPAIRAEASAFSGLRAVLEKPARKCGLTAGEVASVNSPDGLAGIFARLRGAMVAERERYAREGEAVPLPPTIVVAIDQAEELFDPACADGEAFLSTLARAASLDGNVLLVATIRSEIYYRWQTARPLGDLRTLPFNLPPLSLSAFGEVMRGPAALARPPVKISHDLVEALSNELDKADALPLLAATLERLYTDGRKKGEIGLDDYRRLGGLEGTISRAADAAISDAARDGALPRETDNVIALARRLFISSLVAVDAATREPRRQSASLAEIPEPMRQLAKHFVDKRLLVVTSGTDAAGSVEIVHDSVLRRWPALASWIAQEQTVLIQLDALIRAAREWDGQQRSEAWLFHQDARLREAEALLERPDFSKRLEGAPRAYVRAARVHEDRVLDDERARIGRELKQIANTRRFQRIAAGLTALAIIGVLFAGARIILVARNENARASIILAGLSEAAADRGLYSRAERYALSAQFGADAPLVGFDASAAHRALVRSLNANHQLMRLPAGSGIVFDANYSPDGAMIVTAGADGTARIWDARTGRQLHVLSVGHDNALTSAQFSPNSAQLVTASQDGVVRFWDTKSGELTGRLPQVLADLRSAAYSPDGNSLVVAAGLTATLWDVRSQTVTETVSGAGQLVLDAVFSPDGSKIATGSDDFTARVWDIKTKRTIAQFPDQKGIVASIAFSPDGQSLATISADGSLRIFDLSGQKPLVELPGHDGPLSAVRYSFDGKWIVTSAEDGAIQLWSVVAKRMVGRFNAEHSQVNSAAFSQDGRFIVSGDDGGADVWQMPGDIAYAASSGLGSAVLSKDNNRLLIGSADGHAHVINLQTHADSVATGDIKGGSVLEAAFSPDEKAILTAYSMGQARLWSVQSGSPLSAFDSSKQMNEAEFASTGSQIVTAAMDGYARLWNPDTGQAGPALQHNQSGVITAVFFDNGKKVATAGNDKVVRLWDSASGRLLRTLSGHTQEVNEVRFVPGTNFLLTGSDDKQVILWDADSGAQKRVMDGHTGYVRSLAVSPDGKWGASGALDGTVRVWNLDAGAELFRFEDFGAPVRFLAFSPDGTRLVATATDRTVRIWPLTGDAAPVSTALPHGTVIAAACRSLSLHGLQTLRDDEVDAVAKLVPGLGQNACAPSSSLARIRELLGL